MVNGRNFFDQAVTNDLRTYDKIRTVATSQGDDHTTGCLLDYPYFKEYCNLISINLSKQQKLDADPKAIQLIDLPRNLDWAANTQNPSSNLTGDSNDETNFPHKLLLTDTQVLRFCKAFSNGSSANVNFSKTKLSKMVQSGGVIRLVKKIDKFNKKI